MEISINDRLCDRCGVTYGLFDELEVAATGGDIAPTVHCTIEYCHGFMDKRRSRRYGLCPDCRKAFVEFMEGGKQ